MTTIAQGDHVCVEPIVEVVWDAELFAELGLHLIFDDVFKTGSLLVVTSDLFEIVAWDKTLIIDAGLDLLSVHLFKIQKVRCGTERDGLFSCLVTAFFWCYGCRWTHAVGDLQMAPCEAG